MNLYRQKNTCDMGHASIVFYPLRLALQKRRHGQVKVPSPLWLETGGKEGRRRHMAWAWAGIPAPLLPLSIVFGGRALQW